METPVANIGYMALGIMILLTVVGTWLIVELIVTARDFYRQSEDDDPW